MRRLLILVMVILAGCDGLVEGCELFGDPEPLETSTPGATPTTAPTSTVAARTATPAATRTPSATASTTPTARPTATPTASPTAAPSLTVIFDWLVDAGVLLEVDARNYMSQYAEDTLGDITHATRERAGFTENFIDLRWHGGFTFDITQLQADSLNEAVPCDDDLPEHIQVFCDRAQPFRPGTYAFVGAFFEGLMDTEQVPLIIDAVVFETDGNADNNWQAQPGFMDDSYQGTDRWLEVFRSANARQLVATRTNDDGEVDQRGNTMTSGRVILADDTIMMRREVGWIIPFEEVSLNYRVVAVGSSTGDFEPENSGHDYSGTLTDLSPLLPCGGMCEAP